MKIQVIVRGYIQPQKRRVKISKSIEKKGTLEKTFDKPLTFLGDSLSHSLQVNS
ncbi:hypothetical protein D1BOALGB6SA_7804 [Olavius sp. associated proteobacterium Delta 1]|nr:hypothetical protein D1BOALGB6SA_7804 [Olavius sp. associated proteobacterium Delta 1]